MSNKSFQSEALFNLIYEKSRRGGAYLEHGGVCICEKSSTNIDDKYIRPLPLVPITAYRWGQDFLSMMPEC